jgi:hypothetical protein
MMLASGAVMCVAYATGWASGLVLTGSADRSIKVWDPWGRDAAKACVQTLIGHGGSVTTIAALRVRDTFLSCLFFFSFSSPCQRYHRVIELACV